MDFQFIFIAKFRTTHLFLSSLISLVYYYTLQSITVSEFYLTYHQAVVPVLCLPPIILNILKNAFVHLYLPFYVTFTSLKTLYLSITFILIYILEARCTYTGDPYCTHNIVFYFLPYFLITILITYSNLFHDLFIYFITHLFISLLVPLIALVIVLVLYYFIFKLYFILYIHMDYLSEINILQLDKYQ